jgi:hypothetical protein
MLASQKIISFTLRVFFIRKFMVEFFNMEVLCVCLFTRSPISNTSEGTEQVWKNLAVSLRECGYFMKISNRKSPLLRESNKGHTIFILWISITSVEEFHEINIKGKFILFVCLAVLWVKDLWLERLCWSLEWLFEGEPVYLVVYDVMQSLSWAERGSQRLSCSQRCVPFLSLFSTAILLLHNLRVRIVTEFQQLICSGLAFLKYQPLRSATWRRRDIDQGKIIWFLLFKLFS